MSATLAQKPYIERLLDFYVDGNGIAYYQVKWAPTWERADSLNSFQDLTDKFWCFINNSSSANIYNNTSNLKRPPIEIPNKPHLQQFYNPGIHLQELTPKKKMGVIQRKATTPKTPKQTKASMPKQQLTPKQQIKPLTPKQHMSSPNFLQLSQFQQAFINQQQNISSMSPVDNASTLIIDSDDEDVNQKSNLSSANLNFQPQMLNILNGLQATPPWKINVKNEEAVRLVGSTLNIQMNGDGHSQGSNSKRKLGMPDMTGISPAKQPFGLKQEDEADFSSCEYKDGSSPKPMTSSDWKAYFETLENFVDGNKVSQSFKCKVCGSMIAQQSNCSRHFKKHVKDSSGEHACPICEKKFYRIDYMERHLKQHGQGSTEEMKKMIKLITAGMKK